MRTILGGVPKSQVLRRRPDADRAVRDHPPRGRRSHVGTLGHQPVRQLPNPPKLEAAIEAGEITPDMGRKQGARLPTLSLPGVVGGVMDEVVFSLA